MELRGPDYCNVGAHVEFQFLNRKNYRNISFQAIDPSGNELLVKIEKSDHSTISTVRFITSAIGIHIINVLKSKPTTLLVSSKCFAYDLNQEKVHMKPIYWSLESVELLLEMKMHQAIIEYVSVQAHLLSAIDNSINPNVLVKSTLKNLPEKGCQFFFTPPQYGCYEIQFLINNESTTGPRPRVYVINTTRWKLIHSFTTDKFLTSLGVKASFIFELGGAPSEFLKAWIKCPDKAKVDMLLYGEEKNNKIGQLRCDFTPAIIGIHTLYAYYQDVIFDKCPLEFNAYDGKMVKIISIDPDFDSGIKPTVGQTITITYNCLNSGSGHVDVTAIGSEDMGIYSPVPVVKSVRDKKGDVIFSIKLPFAGQYLIEGCYNKEKISVFEVEVSGSLEFKQKNINEFDFDRYDEVDKNLQHPVEEIIESINVMSQDAPLTSNEESTKSMLLSINNETNSMHDNVTPVVYGEGLVEAEVGRRAMFIVDPRREKGKLTVDVIGPKSLAKCLIKPESVQGRYEVEYYPKEIGLYEIDILWNDKPLQGSPFKIEATDPTSIQCVSHQNIFDNILLISVGRKTKIDFSYSLAGNGRMSAFVESSNENTNIKHWTTITKTIWTFWIECKEPDFFEIVVYWNSRTLGRIKVRAESKIDPSPELIESPISQVILKGRGLKGAWVGEIAKFFIDTLNIEGNDLLLSIQDIKSECEKIPVTIKELLNGTYECSYQIKIPGQYLLHVSCGDKVVQGSPFPLNIRDIDPAQGAKCQGDGLNHGFIGEINIITVDLNNVFKDQSTVSQNNEMMLSVTCIGPDLKPIECDLVKQNDNQYQFNLQPVLNGRHELNIMYENIHVPGSPFHPFFTDKQNLENIKVFGPGLKSNHLKNFHSYFTIDTTHAGIGKLRVQVKGPKEAFRVEVQKNPKDTRLIKCSYNPTEKGEYTISINWNGCPIKGSPFKIALD